ncbi:hypothetical protein KFK09_016672 [Dendrobium nobile]|uniref:Uncharacterized protein n=1 Tax=Dendrobium nobile TaxID=94219 RepID=A0A8T3B013_DENNO|nr:hypothetical protein KFK09_016672 [Dendrobium nobile]
MLSLWVDRGLLVDILLVSIIGFLLSSINGGHSFSCLDSFASLPLMYWDNTNLALVASFFGLWVDAQTNSKGRNAFARVCVQMDLGAKLPPRVWISGLHGKFF